MVLRLRPLQLMILGVALLLIFNGQRMAFGITRDSVKIRVVAVNPSDEKIQKFRVKTYLPQEVTPKDIIRQGGLNLKYDTDRSMYYLFKDNVELSPKETRVFEIEVNDIWFIEDVRLDSLGKQADITLERLKETQHYELFKPVAEDIHKFLDKIATTQNDETVSRGQRIGNYRTSLRTIAKIKEDLERMERLMAKAVSAAGGQPPVPDILEKSQIKAKSPSKTTTWMIIFIIMVFIGLLVAVFFFTWQRHSRSFDRIISTAREEAFPKSGKEKESSLAKESPSEKPKVER